MTSKYPSIPIPTNTLDSVYQCLVAMRQCLSLLILNIPAPTTDLGTASQVFATLNAHEVLNQTVVIQNANLTALQNQVNALEAELAAPLAVYPTPAPTQNLHHLNAAGGALLHTGACTFAGFSVNTGVASATMTLYDGTSASGLLLGVFDCAVTDESSRIIPGGGWALTTGCFVDIAGTPDITVVLQ